ncbi:cupin domain-containing protein [Brevibacillus brevis]|uniref:cupin domain-containing protein n=1 Tax=Brevibacillus TaxID=55080 RepID=UPI001C2C4599|nr:MULTISPECIES: cupin domain-containing protein [Brevibacillus]UIO45426.1 cupin domain-containing protein [Brevibacillus brevis]
MMEKVNVAEKFTLFHEYWNPKIAGEINDSYVKLVKLKGEFVWHQHENEDEMFFVVKGKLLIKFRDKDVWLNEGEFLIVPKGVEHMPVAEEEVHVLLLEPKTTLNTGDQVNEKTVTDLETI